MTKLRVLNEIVIKASENVLKNSGVPAIIYEAPTGYGKTSSSIAFYSTLNKYGATSGLIHVLPMRSIAIELYCKVANALGQFSEYCKEFESDEVIAKAVNALGIPYVDVGYQFMDFIDPSKSPFFLKTILITTFNSFFHNLLRFPVGELRKYRRHYEVPRAAIFTSGIVFDEAHLYGGDPGIGSEKSLITAFIVSVKTLAEARVPLLIESATLPDQLRNLLKKVIRDAGMAPKLISFRYGGNKCGSEDVDYSDVECYDEEYASTCLNVKWVTKVINEESVVDIVKQHVNSGRRTLVVRNTVEKAINTYLKLKELFDGVELIHGRFTKSDRALKLIKCRSANIVVSTQVIEAGVNMSFDVLITDSASPSSIVQRAGRVARKCEGGEAYVYVIESSGDGVYDEELTKIFTAKLKNVDYLGYMIEWRIPSSSLINNRVSFLNLVNESYQGISLELDPEKYVNFIDVISRPIVRHEDLEGVYKRFKGLLYTSLLFPIYVGDVVPGSLSELIHNSIPLSLDFIKNNLSKILKLKDDLVLVIALKCGGELSKCELVEYGIARNVLEAPVKLLMYRWSDNDHSIIPLSFVGRPEVYSKEVGLALRA